MPASPNLSRFPATEARKNKVDMVIIFSAKSSTNEAATCSFFSHYKQKIDNLDAMLCNAVQEKQSSDMNDEMVLSSDSLLETSRLTVNTQNSILNITEEDEEEEEDDYVCFAEGNSYLLDDVDDDEDIPIESSFVDSCPIEETSSSLLDQMTESLVDSFCFSEEDKEQPEKTNIKMWKGYHHMVEVEIHELMSCMMPPSLMELDELWKWRLPRFMICPSSSSAAPSPPRGPQRLSLRQRALRLHRLRQEYGLKHHCTPSKNATGAPSLVPVIAFKTSRSMDTVILKTSSGRLESDLDKQIGFGMDPIEPTDETGYDSDPGELSICVDTTTQSKSPPSPKQPTLRPKYETLNELAIVQETFNMTWDLTWHPGRNDIHTNPVCVSVWMERGNLVPKNMIEPSIRWRVAYQPGLASQRKLNRSTQKPFSIRLLCLCRVREPGLSLDKSVYPLARASRCIYMRTSSEDEYLLEAKSERERDDILWRWKQTIARFAMLAVLEDVKAIHKEFFIPSNTSNMLVPNYDDENDNDDRDV